MPSPGDAVLNEFGQPVGPDVRAWKQRPAPPRAPMSGRFCRMEPLTVEHAEALHEANSRSPDARDWTYLPYGPFRDGSEYREWVERVAAQDDPLFFTIFDTAGKAVGVASFMRIDRANGVIELGHLKFSPLMQRSPISTEAIFLMLKRSFDELGYRRCEWKCDSLNMPSRAAAERFGFVFEGIFRKAIVYKGRSRDTAWYSIIDSEWPALRAAYERWLSPENFDAAGRQRARLEAKSKINSGNR
jgi:RimJ/RimL family protein N-acetyltransferase